MVNILSAAAKGVSIIGNHFIEKKEKDKLFQQQRDMWLEGEDFKDIRHFATLNQQDLISKRTAKATVLAATIKAAGASEKAKLVAATKPSITFKGYRLPAEGVPGTSIATSPKIIKDTTKILTEGTAGRKQNEEYSVFLDHYSPLLERLQKSGMSVDQQNKEFRALVEQSGDGDRIRRILNERWAAKKQELRENSDGATVLPTLSSVYSNPVLQGFMKKDLAEQTLEDRPTWFTDSFANLKKNMPAPPQYSVLAAGYRTLLPETEAPLVAKSLSNPEVQNLLGQYDARTYKPKDPTRTLPQNLVDELQPFLPKEVQERTPDQKTEFVSRLFINNQENSKLNPVNRTIKIVPRTEAEPAEKNQKALNSIKNVQSAATDIVQTLSSSSAPFIYDTTGNVIPKFTGTLGVATEVIDAFKTFFTEQKKDSAYAIRTGSAEGITTKTITEIESLDGLRGTSHAKEAVKLLRKHQQKMKDVKAEWGETQDAELKERLQATYNFHMQKVLMVFSYARFLQGQDPRVSNQDFVFVNRALFPDIQLTPDAQRESIIRGMVLLHASTIQPKLTMEAQQKWSVSRGTTESGVGKRVDMGATIPFIKDSFAEEMEKRQALSKSNYREYARKYMGLPDLRISNEEAKTQSREGKVEGAGTLRSATPTTSSQLPSPSTRISNDSLLPDA